MLFHWFRGPNRKRSAKGRKSKSSLVRAKTWRPQVEYLEDRFLPSITVGPNVNISQLPGNQNEASLAINPTNPSNIVAWSNEENAPNGGVRVYVSNDAGASWTNRLIGANDSLENAACCDTQAVFDSFGNLYAVNLDFLSGGGDAVKVLISSDGGASFSVVTIATNTSLIFDQPSIAVGDNTVWVDYTDTSANLIKASGAAITGLGAVGPFSAPQSAPGSTDGSFGGIAVGPNGQVMVTYQAPHGGVGPSAIRVNTDPDGLGPAGFGNAITVSNTNVGGFAPIPPQPNRTIDSEANVYFDRSGGAHNGRAYLVYTDRPSTTSSNTKIFLRFSDDNGTTWSNPVRVSDNTTAKSEFLDQAAIDQSTGFLAVAWYDSRNSTNDVTAQVFATVSFDGGNTFAPSVQVSAGTSNVTVASSGIDYGDYMTMDFVNGVFYPIWSDNSNSTGDNPNGALSSLDIYTAAVTVTGTGGGTTPLQPLVLGPTSAHPTSTTGGTISIVLGNNSGSHTANSFSSSLLAISVPRTADALTGDFNGNGVSDLAVRDASTGQWWVSTTNGGSSAWGSWAPNVNWTNVQVGDFNGDGKADIVGRDPTTGKWWVSLSTGASFVTVPWGVWSTGATWVDVKVGDFNGDGKTDIVGRYQQGGQWWIAQSTGAGFNSFLWATWSTGVTWADVQVADFNHDGMADITGRALQLGQWWTGLSTGTSFTTSLWATWSTAVNWVNVQVGDFNGDGLPDIVGRVQSTGQWWVGQSTGISFSASLWAVWSTGVTWVDVQVGDFNGDGLADITGRAAQLGQWWTAASTGTSFTSSLWATWSTGVTWVDVQTANFNGAEGFVGMAAQSGQWWMATPTVSATSPAPTTSAQPITLGSTTPPTNSSTGPISGVLGAH